jgi:hypothetical protein
VRPSCDDWKRRFVYCPPGISCSYTSADPLFCPDSNGAYSPRHSSQYSDTRAQGEDDDDEDDDDGDRRMMMVMRRRRRRMVMMMMIVMFGSFHQRSSYR